MGKKAEKDAIKRANTLANGDGEFDGCVDVYVCGRFICVCGYVFFVYVFIYVYVFADLRVDIYYCGNKY